MALKHDFLKTDSAVQRNGLISYGNVSNYKEP